MNRKFALVLSGGGFKGAFQVGALEYIFNHPLTISGEQITIDKFDIVAGVSVGSLNGAMVASNQFEELKQLWFEDIAEKGPGIIYESDYIQPDGNPNTDNLLADFIPHLGLFQQLGVLFSQKKRKKLVNQVFDKVANLQSLGDNRPLLETLNRILSLDKFQDVIYRMGFVSLQNGKYISCRADDFAEDIELNKAIQASTTMPIVWAPIDQIKVKDNTVLNLVDGGIRNVSPLADVVGEINRDTDEATEYYIIAINNSAQELEARDQKLNIFSIASRALLDITLSEIFNNDIKHFLFVNKMLRQLNKSSIEIEGKHYKAFNIKIIQPESSLGNPLDAGKEIILKNRRRGFETARKAFEGVNAADWNV